MDQRSFLHSVLSLDQVGLLQMPLDSIEPISLLQVKLQQDVFLLFRIDAYVVLLSMHRRMAGQKGDRGLQKHLDRVSSLQ